MKKTLLAVLMLLSATLVQAGGFSIAAGAFYWYTSADGKMTAPELANYSMQPNLEDDSNFFASFKLEHPIPVLPNVLIAHSSIEHRGNGLLYSDWLDGNVAEVAAITDLSHTDATFYYKVLDNIVSLDIGLTARIFDGAISAVVTQGSISGTSIVGWASNAPLDSAYAFLYLNLAANIPASGLTVGASANLGDNGDERGVDINAYLQYTSFFGLGLTAGYRVLDIQIDSKANSSIGKTDLTADFNVAGPYLGLHYRF